ncbi:MAG: FAD-dependent oxidoreductase [Nanoarchaeota archaeon]|nr:FAD-dependent oxidoreductase [Nanoarchaeota archaeon]
MTQKNSSEKTKKVHDLIIVGGGPAGMSAAIYAARYMLDTLMVTWNTGGLAATAHKICNYPSYVDCSGFELMQKFTEHVASLKVPIAYEGVKTITKQKKSFSVITESGKEYFARRIIYAAGTNHRHLNIPGEDKYSGRGVSYCATCDGPLFRAKTVAVIGGGDAALTSALLLSEHAKKVYIIYRKSKFFRAEPTWVKLVEKNPKIKVIFNQELTEIVGDKFVTGVKLKDNAEPALEGVFIEIGSVPNTETIKGLGIKTENDYIKVDKNQETNIRGFYAAGDITANDLKQIITASAEGAVAAYNIYNENTKEK